MNKFQIWRLQKKVAKKTVHWQEVLRMQRWLINGQLTEGEDCSITYDTDHYSAVMNIGTDLPKWELDYAICHELLHLLLAEKLTEEQQTELIARAVVRGNKKHFPSFWEVLTCVLICNAICLGIHFLLFWG